MSNDDQSPERTKTDRVADWVDTTQEQGGTPSRVDAVADAARREGSNRTTGATPSIDEMGRDRGDFLHELEEEMGQAVDTARSTELGPPSQRAEGTAAPSEHADANPNFGIEWPLDGGRSDSGADDLGGIDDSGFSPSIDDAGASDSADMGSDFSGADDSGFTGGDDSGFTGSDDSGFTGSDDSGFTGSDDSGFTGSDDSGFTGSDDSGFTGSDDSGF